MKSRFEEVVLDDFEVLNTIFASKGVENGRKSSFLTIFKKYKISSIKTNKSVSLPGLAWQFSDLARPGPGPGQAGAGPARPGPARGLPALRD